MKIDLNNSELNMFENALEYRMNEDECVQDFLRALEDLGLHEDSLFSRNGSLILAKCPESLQRLDYYQFSALFQKVYKLRGGPDVK